MELLTSTLVIILLTTASAKPAAWHRHYDADITDNDSVQEWLGKKNWWFLWSSESSRYEDSSSETELSMFLDQTQDSSESSESLSSEESSDEVVITDQTTPLATTPAMTTMSSGDGSMLTSEAGTRSTDEPTVSPPPATPTVPVLVTSPSSVTHCVTKDIPTAAPITENRGDN